MFMFGNSPYGHRYSLAATGLKIKKNLEFASRHQANEYMYKLVGKHGLKLEKMYDDKHFKTYIYNNGIRFYVNRI